MLNNLKKRTVSVLRLIGVENFGSKNGQPWDRSLQLALAMRLAAHTKSTIAFQEPKTTDTEKTWLSEHGITILPVDQLDMIPEAMTRQALL